MNIDSVLSLLRGAAGAACDCWASISNPMLYPPVKRYNDHFRLSDICFPPFYHFLQYATQLLMSQEECSSSLLHIVPVDLTDWEATRFSPSQPHQR